MRRFLFFCMLSSHKSIKMKLAESARTQRSQRRRERVENIVHLELSLSLGFLLYEKISFTIAFASLNKSLPFIEGEIILLQTP